MRLPDQSRSTPRQLWVLALVTAGAGVLRLISLGKESFWIDEVTQSKTASLISSQGWRAIASRDKVSPLSQFILWLVQRMFGTSEAAARLPSAIAGIVLVPVAYALGKRLFNARIGLITAVLVAISPYSVWYSRDARMYSLLALVSALYLLCFVRVVAQPSRTNTLGLIVLGAIGLYVHQYFLLLIVGSTGYVAYTSFRSNRHLAYRLFASNAVSIVCFAPWIAAASGYNPGSAGSQRGGVVFFAPYTLLTFIIGFDLGPSIREMQTAGAAAAMRHEIAAVAVPIAVLIVVAAAFVATLRRHRKEKSPDDALYFTTTVTVAMIGLPVMISAVSSDINFNVRYCVGALVPALILVAVAVDGIRARGLRTMLFVALGIVLALSTFRVVRPGDRYAREDIRSVSRYLSASPPRGPLLVESDTVVEGLRWYGFNGPLVAVHNTVDPAIAADIDGPHTAGDTVTLVQSREWETDPRGAVEKRLLAAGFVPDKSRSFAGARVSEFRFAAPGTKP